MAFVRKDLAIASGMLIRLAEVFVAGTCHFAEVIPAASRQLLAMLASNGFARMATVIS
jgi:hypothetical protein